MYRLWESKMFKKQVLLSKYSLQSTATSYLQHLFQMANAAIT